MQLPAAYLQERNRERHRRGTFLAARAAPPFGFDVVDGSSVKPDRAILRRSIWMTCWFEPLILRLGPAHHVIELIRRDQLDRAHDGGTSLSGYRLSGYRL